MLLGVNKICKSLSGVVNKVPGFNVHPTAWAPVRWSSGGNKNKKQAPGKHKGIKKQDGTYVFPGDVLVYRQGTKKIWFHPGLNVGIAIRFMNLVALKEGVVRVTCEKPDLNFEELLVKKFYTGREGQTFFKKHFNVIPKPQHTMFKCIDQV